MCKLCSFYFEFIVECVNFVFIVDFVGIDLLLLFFMFSASLRMSPPPLSLPVSYLFNLHFCSKILNSTSNFALAFLYFFFCLDLVLSFEKYIYIYI